MLNFRKVTVEDKPIIDAFLGSKSETSCESTFMNMLMWQDTYGMRVCVQDDCLLFVTDGGDGETYGLPYGNFAHGMELLRSNVAADKLRIWAQDGERFEKFCALYGENYDISETRDAFDYVYLRSDLAELSGKKYQSKRNHISAFSRSVSWRYEPVCADNADAVRKCALQWYDENSADSDKYLCAERDGVLIMLDNLRRLGIVGGAVVADGKVVAFTLGTPINSDMFDTHIEKALREYSSAYAVVNREFARSLDGYKYINREDDMGLEGLRRAKTSYRPDFMVKKYVCVPR